MLVCLVSLLYSEQDYCMCQVRCIFRLIFLGHHYLTIHPPCSLLEVDGELSTILNFIDNLVVCHNSIVLVNRSALRESVA